MATFTKCDKCGKIKNDENQKDIWVSGYMRYNPSWAEGFKKLKHIGDFAICGKCSSVFDKFAKRFFKDKEISKE